MEKLFDVIIPVAGKEAEFVHRVTKYVRKCLQGADRIYIITNERYIKKIECSLKGQEYVTILDENTLIDGLTFDGIKEIAHRYTSCTSPGWFYQQFLKYGFALTPYAKKYYLSWDADTIPIAKISFFENERPVFTRKYEYNDNYFATVEKILGLKKIVPFSFVAEHMVFESKIVKEILDIIAVCNVEGSSWAEKIMRAGNFDHIFPPFSEFETYGTYVMTYYPDRYDVRQLNTFRHGGWIKGRLISDKMLDKLSFDVDSISFEMRHEPLFPYNLPNKWWLVKDYFLKVLQNKPTVVFHKIWNKIHNNIPTDRRFKSS
jgi:hypothetical protein